jgi:hypothetical protein
MSKSLPEGSLFQGHLCALVPWQVQTFQCWIIIFFWRFHVNNRIFRNILKDSFTKSFFLFFILFFSFFKGEKFNVFLESVSNLPTYYTRVHILTVVGWLVGFRNLPYCTEPWSSVLFLFFWVKFVILWKNRNFSHIWLYTRYECFLFKKGAFYILCYLLELLIKIWGFGK